MKDAEKKEEIPKDPKEKKGQREQDTPDGSMTQHPTFDFPPNGTSPKKDKYGF